MGTGETKTTDYVRSKRGKKGTIKQERPCGQSRAPLKLVAHVDRVHRPSTLRFGARERGQ